MDKHLHRRQFHVNKQAKFRIWKCFQRSKAECIFWNVGVTRRPQQPQGPEGSPGNLVRGGEVDPLILLHVNCKLGYSGLSYAWLHHTQATLMDYPSSRVCGRPRSRNSHLYGRFTVRCFPACLSQRYEYVRRRILFHHSQQHDRYMRFSNSLYLIFVCSSSISDLLIDC